MPSNGKSHNSVQTTPTWGVIIHKGQLGNRNRGSIVDHDHIQHALCDVSEVWNLPIISWRNCWLWSSAIAGRISRSSSSSSSNESRRMRGSGPGLRNESSLAFVLVDFTDVPCRCMCLLCRRRRNWFLWILMRNIVRKPTRIQTPLK